MRRVFNEINHDAADRGRGVKVGDFGSGGRTYRKYDVVAGGHHTKQCASSTNYLIFRVIAVIIGVGGLISLYFSERSAYLVYGAAQEASASTTLLRGSQLVASSDLFGQLVHLPSHGPLTINGPERVMDDFFHISADEDDVALRRVTEYCQWVEIEHRNRVKVGQNPDFCARASSSEKCNGLSCSSYGRAGCQNLAECCSWEHGDEIYETSISYSYHKGWRSSRINSLLFDNPAAYHNPQRDPAPSSEFWLQGDVLLGTDGWNGIRDNGACAPDCPSGGSKGSGDLACQPRETPHTGTTAADTAHPSEGSLHVRGTDLKDILEDWRLLPLEKEHSLQMGSRALQSGFHEVSHQHIYSRVAQDGLNNPLLRASASYIVDGVLDLNAISKGIGLESLLAGAGLDWLTKGTCNAGDIRVHFEARHLPATAVTVLGEYQHPARIVPHTYSSGQTLLMARQGYLSKQQLLSAVTYRASLYSWLARGGVFLALCVVAAAWQSYLLSNSGFFSGFGLVLVFFGASLSFVWLYFYGVMVAAQALLFGCAGVIVLFLRTFFIMRKNYQYTKQCEAKNTDDGVKME